MGDVSRSSITLSSASYASSLFPSVDDTTASLIEAILARVSPSEAEWKPFLQAYDEVFNERGLDKQSDTIIYDLILKLGLQAGKNWRSKWENVKRTQEHLKREAAAARAGGGRVDQPVDIAAARKDAFRTPLGKANVHTHHTATPAAARRDYAQDDGQARLTQEALDTLQNNASPYKPLRTPFRPPGNINLRDGTTPRVHFAQDAHKTHPRAHSDVFRTPELAISTPTHTSEEREAMLQQALQFDRINLLGRMYDDWISRYFVLKRLEMHTSIARDALLKRRSLTFWSERVKRHAIVEERVEVAYEATLKRSCLRLWKEKQEKKQKTAWERQISLAYRAITKKKDKQTKQAVFAAWREASLESRANRFHTINLLHHSLGKWLSNAARLAELNVDADNLQAKKETEIRSESFSKWQQNTILVLREAEVVEKKDEILLQNSFTSWRVQFEDVRLADQYSSRITKRSALSIWRTRFQRHRAVYQQALSLSRARDEDTMERAYHTWKIREHSRLIERAKTVRLIKGAFQRWRDRYEGVSVKLNTKAVELTQSHHASVTKDYLTKWIKATSERQKVLRIAGTLNDRLTLQRSFVDWKEAIAHRRLEQRKAAVANNFFTQRNALRTWVRKMRWAKANLAVLEKEKTIKRDYLQTWREKTVKARHFAILEEGITAAIDQRILSTTLNSWTNRVIELRARLITVSTSCDTTILHQAFKKWSTKSRQNIENLSLVDSFIELQEEDLLRNRFRKWHASMKRKISLRERLELKLKEDEEALKAGVLERWIDAFRERQLVEQEEQVLQYRTHRSLRGAFRRWKNNTMTLPAIRFHARRQRKFCFTIWKDRLPEKVDENIAIEHDRLRLQHVTLTIWLEASRAKAARRAANRFRAFASRTPLPSSWAQLHPSSAAVGRVIPRSTHASSARREGNGTAITPVSQRTALSAPQEYALGAGASAISTAGGYTKSHTTPRPFPSSISMPHLYPGSASNLRKEVSSTTPRRRVTATTHLAPPVSLSSYERTMDLRTPTRAVTTNTQALVLGPESVALPLSSSTTGPSASASSSSSSSSLASSPLARPNDIPLSSNLDGTRIESRHEAAVAGQPGTSSEQNMQLRRRRSTLKDAFEEGVLREMRERLNAVGLGGGGGGVESEDAVRRQNETRSRSRRGSRSAM